MTPDDSPLNLHVVAETKEQLNQAIDKIKDITSTIIQPTIGGIKMYGSPYLV